MYDLKYIQTDDINFQMKKNHIYLNRISNYVEYFKVIL